MAESVATSMAMPSTSAYSNLITAEIRVENLSASSSVTESTISVPTSSTSPQQQQQLQQNADGGTSSAMDNNNQLCEFDEPEKKRLKLDTHPLKAKKLEKLENRLGGILCCAVCLDLPKTAMYQVSVQHFHSFCLCQLRVKKI